MKSHWFFSEDGRLRAGWRAAIGFIGMALVVVVVAPILASVLSSSNRGPRFEMAYRNLSALILVALFWWCARTLDRVRTGTLRYTGIGASRAALRDGILGFLIGLVTITVAVTAISLIGGLEVRGTFTATTLRRAAFVTLLILGGAVTEELMFRGYVFQRLAEATRPIIAVAVLSVLFGAVHLGNPSASVFGTVNTALVGAAFAMAYLRTQSLWLPIGWHFSWNFTLGLVFGLPVSGINSFSVVTTSHARGPEWLTGGSYGIEASLTGTVVILLGLFLVLRFAPDRRKDSLAADTLNVAPGRFGLTDEGSSGIQIP